MYGNLADLNFNAAEVEPATERELVPAAWYTAVLTESGIEPTKAGNGKYLKCTFQIIEGEHEGRFIWANINIQNASATAERIGKKELSALCHAVGVLTPNDSTELHDRPLEIKVSVKPPKDGYAARNEVDAYRAIGSAGSTGQAPPASAPKAVPNAAPAGAKAPPPWKKTA